MLIYRYYFPFDPFKLVWKTGLIAIERQLLSLLPSSKYHRIPSFHVQSYLVNYCIDLVSRWCRFECDLEWRNMALLLGGNKSQKDGVLNEDNRD